MLCAVCYVLRSVFCYAQCVMLCAVCYAVLSALLRYYALLTICCVCDMLFYLSSLPWPDIKTEENFIIQYVQMLGFLL
jgi:hypothetical protein